MALAAAVALPRALPAQAGHTAARSAAYATLDRIVAKAVNGRSVRGAVVRVASGDGAFDYQGSAGELSRDTTYFIASTTKLFVTAMVLQLRAEGRLSLDDSLASLLPEEEWRGLNVRGGIDRSGAITVRQLLAHTSGLPDYFEGTRADGRRLDRELLSGRDQAWTTADALAAARGMTPHFPPGARGKAHYSDTNFQLLGRIIEVRSGMLFDDALAARVLQPLGLVRTYMYRDTSDRRPATIIGKPGPLHMPRAMASFGPDGGIVSTATEQLTFLRAFFQGRLFPASDLDELRDWNGIFFPIESGVGVMRFRLPRWLSPFSRPPELIGHSGLSGAFAFFEPERDLYLVGTLNSVVSPGASFRLMLKLVRAVPK
jgi:CubicO group peptidase (beta-lactamase class C family)